MDRKNLIERCKNGDNEALGLLYKSYSLNMKAVCLRYVKDESLSEDVMHDGFIIIFKSIGQLKDPAKLESWMTMIMRNVALRYLRDSGRNVSLTGAVLDDNTERLSPPADANSLYDELLRLIETLPEGYRSVFKLSVLGGMSHNEIGRKLGIKPHSSSSQLSRARDILRVLLRKYGFVIICFVELMHPQRLEMPVKRLTPRQKYVFPVVYTEVKRNISQPQKYHEAPLYIPAVPIDTASKEAETAMNDSSVIERRDTVVLQKSYDDRLVAHDDKTVTRQQESQNSSGWTASVTYSGGLEADHAVVTMVPGIGSGTGEDVERVEKRYHNHIPFVLQLSLQKRIDRRLSLGLGLRYTRIVTDISTIGETETVNVTLRYEYIGLPVSLTYHLWQHENLSLYTSLGFNADIPVGRGKTWLWSSTAGLGLQLRAYKNFSLFVEPGLNWYINGFPSSVNGRCFGFTVPVGLRFSW